MLTEREPVQCPGRNPDRDGLAVGTLWDKGLDEYALCGS